MHVSSLRLINVRCFRDEEIKLSPSINLLVGNNNSGKSTILKALYKLQSLHSLGADDIRKNKISASIFMGLENLNEQEARDFPEKNNTGVRPILKDITVNFGITKQPDDSNILSNNFFDTHEGYDVDENGEYFHRITRSGGLYQFGIFPDNEIQGNFIYPFFAKRKINRYSFHSNPKEAHLVAEDLRNIATRISLFTNPTNGKYAEFTEAVQHILGFKIGNVIIEGNYSVGVFAGTGKVIPIDNMGEGVVNIIGLIALVMSEDRKLFLIEELENDIHPAALKKLLDLIIKKSKNNQFIISTHSNIVVKYLGLANAKIFSLKWSPWEPDTLSPVPTASVVELEDNPTAKLNLLEELGYDIFDFDLHKSYIIFEESSAEAIFKNYLIPIFYPHLAHQVKTIAAGGVADIKARFQDFLRLFVFIHNTPVYNSRAWVIADGDAAGKVEVNKLREKFSSWSHEHFINLSKNNVEEFFPAEFQEEFHKINLISDKQKKREAKIIFNNQFRDWWDKNPETAKTKFSQSGQELLNILKEIDAKLNPSKK